MAAPSRRGVGTVSWKGTWQASNGRDFRLGQDLKLKKMAATMTPKQVNARASFEALGFQVEATLQGWVVDRAGESHNLLVMSLVCER